MTRDQFKKSKLPTPLTNAFASKALGTPPIVEEERRPKYNFVYYFEDGGVTKLFDFSPDAILTQEAYLVMVSIPGTPKSAPYVEIIKTRHGNASLIMTCDPSTESGRS